MTSTSTGGRVRQWLMTGVSYMIPFVAAGGILIALGFLLGGFVALANGGQFSDGINVWNPEVAHTGTTVEGGSGEGYYAPDFNLLNFGSWAYLIFWLGKTAFALFVPALAAYIAYAIADRPGIAPGFVAGALASGLGGAEIGGLHTSTGFLGAILGGFVAGLVALWVSRWKVANWIRPIMPVVVIPLIATFVAGAAMVFVFKGPIGALMTGLTDWLKSIPLEQMIILGIILGLMMAFDMGGPVNKVAYGFGTAALGTAMAAGAANLQANELVVMAIVMAAGMTPPLGLALATVLRKKLFSESELENGKAAWLMGASFITEGAIPFAAADPIRVIPSIMAGSAVTGALVAVFQDHLPAPHGGIFVFPLMGVEALTYTLAIAIGAVVTALLVIVLKGSGAKK